MAEYINIKRKPQSISPLYDAPQSDECYDHCITLNGEDLEKVGCDMPDTGDLCHVNVMARVVGFGDDHGHRYIRLEITDIMLIENETTETAKDE